MSTLAEQIRGETYDGFQIVEFTQEEHVEMVRIRLNDVIHAHEQSIVDRKARESVAAVVASITDTAAFAVNTVSVAVSWMTSAFSSTN